MESSHAAPVGLIGVGAMGRPMAEVLLRAGVPVLVFDVRSDAVDSLRAQGAGATPTPRAMAEAVSTLIVMVQSSRQVRAAFDGPGGVLAGLDRQDGTREALRRVLLMSTVAPADARQLAAECAERGCRLLDAPVSGGPGAAAEGRLSIMVGGPTDLLEELRSLLTILGDPARIWHVGSAAGDGQAMKMVNHLMAGVNIAASCEAMALAAKAGLDPRQAFDIVSQSAGSSWMFRDRVPRMLEGRFTPPRSVLDIFVKDLGIVDDAASSLGLPLFVASAAREVFKAGAAAGLGGEDDAGLIRFYERLAGVAVGPPADR